MSEDALSSSWMQSLSLMREALQTLDQCRAPLEIGAHLDMAINRLTQRMAEAATTMRECPE